MRGRDRLIRLAAGWLLVLGVGCGTGATSAASDKGTLNISLPSQILGLRVQQEQLAKGLEDVDRPYFDALALFSLRENDLLRASLEIGRFNSFARPKSEGFRNQILGKIGSREPRSMRVGRQTIYVTAGNQQAIFVWFDGDGVFVMITHQDFAFPRTLLRRILDLNLEL